MLTETTILLKSPRLAVEIAKPGTVYAGSRFDWTGFITQVTLDDTHTFCAYEDPVPGHGSGGIGICNDFGLNLPIAYAEAAPGEEYLKVGIGNVQKLDAPQPFIHMLQHRITRHAELRYEAEEDRVTFLSVNPPCNGYRCRHQKTVRVEDNHLVIDYEFENIGEKPIETEEYTHNFLAIDGLPYDENYRLQTAFRVDEKGRQELVGMSSMMPGITVSDDILSLGGGRPSVTFKDGELLFREAVSGQYYTRGNLVANTGEHFRLSNRKAGCYVAETDSFDAPYMAIWGIGSCIAVEAFCPVKVAPGENARWTRTYTFDTL